MNNGLPGPSTTDTVTGGKTLELSDYDKVRLPHKIRDDGTMIRINVRTLSSELCCPICLDLLTSTMTTKECLHRFCEACITTALKGNKECPTCRKKIVSKRSLRPDPNFDALISKIWPDRRKYEEMQEEQMRNYHQQNSVEALQKSIEAGMKAQEVNRRKRVQGSYDYEKRKRRPKQIPPSSEGTGTSAEMNGVEPPASPRNRANDRGDSESGDSDDSDCSMYDSSSLSSDVSDTSDSSGASTVASGAEEKSLADGSSLRSSSVDCSHHPPGNPATGPKKRGRKPGPKPAAKKSTAAATADQASSNAPIRPPSAICDKMSEWMAERDPSSSPCTGMDGDAKGATTSKTFCPSYSKLSGPTGLAEKRLAEMRKSGDEIEVELVPAKSLLTREETGGGLSEGLSRSRYVRAPPDTTMAHLSEFLRQACQTPERNGDQHGLEEEKKDIPTQRVEYFYILDNNYQLRKMFLHDTLYSAFITSTMGTAGDEDGYERHLMIFFETAAPDVNSHQPLLNEIVSDELSSKIAGAKVNEEAALEKNADLKGEKPISESEDSPTEIQQPVAKVDSGDSKMVE